MQVLKPHDIADFLARFSNFYDAVLHEFSCKPGSVTSCELIFEAQDKHAPSGWSRVVVRLENVTSWKFAESMNCAFYIISSGVHLLYRDELFYMDVNELGDPSEDINDFLGSDFHFVAPSFQWQAVNID